MDPNDDPNNLSDDPMVSDGDGSMSSSDPDPEQIEDTKTEAAKVGLANEADDDNPAPNIAHDVATSEHAFEQDVPEDLANDDADPDLPM